MCNVLLLFKIRHIFGLRKKYSRIESYWLNFTIVLKFRAIFQCSMAGHAFG